ncbi:hypothetical protein, partial [Pseudophaeobacter profundi]|uniref:hypothetical protein n=1 Tax=Pseudophaeobacter profundi TaxID=3034152 RepID=UPI00242E88E3
LFYRLSLCEYIINSKLKVLITYKFREQDKHTNKNLFKNYTAKSRSAAPGTRDGVDGRSTEKYQKRTEILQNQENQVGF